jgi:two-component system LytT family sensor kinase
MNRARSWLIPFAFWSIPALLVTAISTRETGRTLAQAFVTQGLPWYYWAAVTPAIFHLTRRFPFETLRQTRGFVRHLGAAILFGIGFSIVTSVLLYLLPATTEQGERGMREVVVSAVTFGIFFGLLFYCMIASVGFALGSQERLRERELASSRLEARLVEAQLGALRMQLQPHFLFNSLHTIALYVREGDAATSTRLLARLSEMLRHLLDDGGAQEVPLNIELGHARRYLDIEHARFSDRLTVRYDVPEQLEDALVPNLVLQPLIENAVRHGVASRAAPGVICIAARHENGDLILTVTNDGAHLPDGFDAAGATGIGLRNTSLRLEHLYHSAGKVSLKNWQGGVVAEVTIPHHRSPVNGHSDD